MAGYKRRFRAGTDEAVRSVSIGRFGGLEMRAGEASFNPCRSPDALNMMIGAGGTLTGRPGYKALRDFTHYGGTIYGLHNMMIDGEERLLIHVGPNLWLLRDTGYDRLADNLNPAPSTGFAAGGSYFLMDGAAIHKITGRQVEPALANPYIPLTRARARPNGTGGGGEAANLLTAYRRNSFVTDGETAVFHLDAYPVAGTVTAELQSGEILTAGAAMTVYQHAATVTFKTPPSAGEEGVIITFMAAGRYTGHGASVSHTRIHGRFGGSVFLTGNPDFPAYEWGSPDMARAYFPETLCGFVGDRGTPIAGYVQHQDALAILKRPGNDHGIYLRTGDSTPRPGGDVPAACAAIGRMGGRSLYLAPEGVMEIAAATRTEGRESRCRSAAIAPLLSGRDIGAAGIFIHADTCYLAADDSLIVGQNAGEEGREQIEWNRWTPISAEYFGRWKGGLCFSRGSELFRLCDPGESGAYTDLGQPIAAHWTTPPMDMGDRAARGRLTDLTLRPGTGGQGAMRVVRREADGSATPIANVPADMGEALRLRPGGPAARRYQLRLESAGPGSNLSVAGMEIGYRRAVNGR